MPQPATLTFTVNTFRSLATGGGIMTTGAGPSADVNVSLSPTSGTNVTVASDGSITVTGRGAQIIALQATGYQPVGLVFKQTLGSSDPSGGNAFGNYVRSANNSNQLVVTDNDQGDASWEFYLLIQNTSSGDFGLIDPRITNN
jgi:hypothetical protein